MLISFNLIIYSIDKYHLTKVFFKRPGLFTLRFHYRWSMKVYINLGMEIDTDVAQWGFYY